MSAITEPTAAVAAEALSWPARAKALTITDQASYVAAAETLKAIKALRAKKNETIEPIKAKTYAAWKAVCDEDKRLDAPLIEAETIIKRGMVAYDQAQERARREEQQRLAEEARKAEESRRLAEAAAMEREATSTGDAALLAEADALISEPVIAPVVVLPTATPKVAGVSYREEWDFEVLDDAKIPREYLVRDDAKIRRVVKAMKGTTNIPGVRAFSRRVVAAGGGR